MKAPSLSNTQFSGDAFINVNGWSAYPDKLIARRGYTVLMAGTHGWIGDGTEGFYLHRTRFLSRMAIKVDGADPRFVAANAIDHHCLTSYHLASSPAGRAAGPTPEDDSSNGGEIVAKGIELQVNAYTGGGLRIDIILVNHALTATEVALSLELEADFADLTEAEKGEREQQAEVVRSWTLRGESQGELELRYSHPRLQHATRIRIAGADALADEGGAVGCRLALRPQEPRALSVEIIPIFQGEPVAPFYRQDGAVSPGTHWARSCAEWSAGCTRLTGAELIQAAWERAVSDVASLQTLEGTGAEPFAILAGIPNTAACSAVMPC